MGLHQGASLATFIYEAGLDQAAKYKWGKISIEERRAILADLWARTMPDEVLAELSGEDRHHIELRANGVRGVPIPSPTRPSREPQCHELREMIQEGAGIPRDQFLAEADHIDLDELPMVTILFVTLYYDVITNKFSPETFEKQYNNGNGPDD